VRSASVTAPVPRRRAANDFRLRAANDARGFADEDELLLDEAEELPRRYAPRQRPPRRS